MADRQVQLISVTTPNGMHREITLAALAVGKHVWCKKSMALTLDDARAMEAAAVASGLLTQLGYNDTDNAAFTHACRPVAAGEIGRVVHLRGWVDESYQADPALHWS